MLRPSLPKRRTLTACRRSGAASLLVQTLPKLDAAIAGKAADAAASAQAASLGGRPRNYMRVGLGEGSRSVEGPRRTLEVRCRGEACS